MFLMKRRPPGSARTDTLFHYTTLFRSQGAPLAPVFHAALAATLEKPLAVLNIGGVANVTWIGPGGAATPISREDTLIAFDTGPGNALLDDWVLAHTGRSFDKNGRLAATGTVDATVLSVLMAHTYFERPPPTSSEEQTSE